MIAVAQSRSAAIGGVDVRRAASALSPEFLLTIACCRWPPSHEQTTAVRAAAKHVTNWHRFLSVVKNHRVAVLVQRSFRTAALDVSAAIAAELDAIFQCNVRRGLKLAAETVRLQSLLTERASPAWFSRALRSATGLWRNRG